MSRFFEASPSTDFAPFLRHDFLLFHDLIRAQMPSSSNLHGDEERMNGLCAYIHPSLPPFLWAALSFFSSDLSLSGDVHTHTHTRSRRAKSEKDPPIGEIYFHPREREGGLFTVHASMERKGGKNEATRLIE